MPTIHIHFVPNLFPMQYLVCILVTIYKSAPNSQVHYMPFPWFFTTKIFLLSFLAFNPLFFSIFNISLCPFYFLLLMSLSFYEEASFSLSRSKVHHGYPFIGAACYNTLVFYRAFSQKKFSCNFFSYVFGIGTHLIAFIIPLFVLLVHYKLLN